MRKYVFEITDELSNLHEELIEAGGMHDAFQRIHHLAKEKHDVLHIRLKGVIY